VKLPGGYEAICERGFDPIANAITGTSSRIIVELAFQPNV
jgi:hypothetical protein